MIVDEFVEVSCASTNKKRYEELGYVFINKVAKVKVLDLSYRSGVLITVSCDFCGTIYKVRCVDYNKAVKLRGKYCCKHCIGAYTKVAFTKVVSKFTEAGLTPMFTEVDYINGVSKLKFVCNIHMNEIQTAAYSHLFYMKHPCKFCRSEYQSLRMTGSSHFNWCGGTSLFKKFLRNSTLPWINRTLIQYNYTCDVAGQVGRKNLIVHHLNIPFSVMRDTAIRKFNITASAKNMSEYTQKDLLLISEYLLKEHYIHGLGVVINKPIHTLFHKLYGHVNNTSEQYYEFKSDFQKGYILFS
jgi:hypothetical protein